MRIPRLALRLIILAVAMAVLMLAWLVLPYKISRYRGDGTITDGGIWSHPRYQIRFSPIELRTGQTRQYRFGGAPPVTLSLKLEVVDPPRVEEKNSATLSSAETRVAVTIADDRGHVVLAASGPLKNWVLTTSNGYAAYWHRDAVNVGFRERTAYSMSVSVSGDSAAPNLVIVPTLEGGGNELP